MKTTAMVVGAALFGVTGAAFAQTPSGMQGMQMAQGTQSVQKHDMAQGTGVVKAVDTAKGTVTIQHHAIASVHWPAMTMIFTADPRTLLQSVKVGEQVTFTLHPDGAHSTVTAIAPAR